MENIGSSVAEHDEKMRVLDMQLSHLAKIKEQLLELDLALRSCKTNLSSYHKFCQDPNFWIECKKVCAHTISEKLR